MNTVTDNIIRIAIIDDNAPLRDITAKQLESSGFMVLFQADNGQEAVEKIIENGSLPDVCIIEEDLSAAKIVLEKYPGLKVLISSMNDDEESVMDMLKTGVSGYILKYTDPDEIVTAIKALNENKLFFSVGINEIASAHFQ